MIDTLKEPNFFASQKNWQQWREEYNQPIIMINNLIFDEINFSNFDFSSVHFIDCQFERCIFQSTNLISTNLARSKFIKCDFSNAKLIASELHKTNFEKCIFNKTNFLTAVFDTTSISDSDLTDVDLQSFNLVGVSFNNCDLSGQDLSGKDFSKSSLVGSNLTNTNLTNTIFNSALLDNCLLKHSIIKNTQFKHTSLKFVDFSAMNLNGINFDSADLTESNLSFCDLRTACLEKSTISRAHLHKAQYSGWNIKDIKCTFAYWDKDNLVKTEYKPFEFERLYAEPLVIELKYDIGLTSSEIVTLPILIQHLQACHWGIKLRLKSVNDVAGGSLIKIVVDKAGSYPLSELKLSISQEAERIQKAQIAIRSDHKVQKQFKEAVADIKEQFWPRLLEIAAEYEMEKAKDHCVLFIDLKDFSQWNKGDISEKLSLFRGLLKPILEKWKSRYPNMEGDSLRASFNSVEAAIQCALMIRKVLMAAQFQLRIGIDVGEVTVVHNEITEQSDLEGVAVSMAARLEAMANTGEILVSQDVKYYADKSGLQFKLTPEKRQLTKAIGNRLAGEWINIYYM
jgi:uncharacterized protein YjbI with pentapeptide repeats/class 3 adenylate cyclase